MDLNSFGDTQGFQLAGQLVLMKICPLAPLLFLLAATSTLAKSSYTNFPDQEQKFSAFVDDSTVFLQRAEQIPLVLNLVQRFGELSGFFVQPAKSGLIFVNAAVEVVNFKSIPVLQHGQTTRYLGDQVGTGDLVDATWALRMQNVRKRLATSEASPSPSRSGFLTECYHATRSVIYSGDFPTPGVNYITMASLYVNRPQQTKVNPACSTRLKMRVK